MAWHGMYVCYHVCYDCEGAVSTDGLYYHMGFWVECRRVGLNGCRETTAPWQVSKTICEYKYNYILTCHNVFPFFLINFLT